MASGKRKKDAARIQNSDKVRQVGEYCQLMLSEWNLIQRCENRFLFKELIKAYYVLPTCCHHARNVQEIGSFLSEIEKLPHGVPERLHCCWDLVEQISNKNKNQVFNLPSTMVIVNSSKSGEDPER